MSTAPTATAADPLHYAAPATQPLTPTQAGALIFGPDLYPHYVNWQTDIADPAQAALYPTESIWRTIVHAVQEEDLGGVPSPQTFKTFMNTQRVKEHLYGRSDDPSAIEPDGEQEKEEGTSDLLISRLCKHTIHPGNPCTTTEMCPVCLMNQCLVSLERIAHVWRLVGGPYRPSRSDQTGVFMIDPEELMIYYAMRKLWQSEKARWGNLVNIYEHYAMGERLWEEDSRQDGFEVPAEVQMAKSCMEALGVAMRSPFVVEGWGEVFVPMKYLSKRSVAAAELRGSSVDGAEEAELPFSPPETPETEAEMLRCSDEVVDGTQESGDHTAHHINGEHSNSPATDHAAVRERPPSASPQDTISPNSTIYMPSPTQPPASSPPQTPHSHFIPSSPMIGVSFPDDLASPSTRKSSYFSRTSTLYKQGKHASPSGSTWVDTSFMSDSTYDNFGVEEDNDDEELERLMKIRDESFQDAHEIVGQRFAGFTDVDLDSEDKEAEQESNWSDDSDGGNGEDDLRIHLGRRTEGAKRLPGQTMGLSVRRPVFAFSWRQQPESGEAHKTAVDDVSDEFDDDEVEQAMRVMDSEIWNAHTTPSVSAEMPTGASDRAEKMEEVSLVEPESQVTPRRRSRGEFVGCEGMEKEEHFKRLCH